MTKTALITGITGQDGTYLARLLLEKGYTVHGGLRRIGVMGTGRLDDLGITDDVEMHDFELLEFSNIRRVVEKTAPDEIYNLAAQSFVGVSYEIPVYTSDVDALGVMRVLEAMRDLNSQARFYQASTSEMFGKVQTSPQNEQTPFYPRSPYGVSKLFGHWTTVNFREAFGLHASSGILFNHESPLRGKEFVTRKITLGFARMHAGKQEILTLGNLDARRDWGYAEDYVEGIWKMLQQDEPDDYVLASGENKSIRSFVEVAGSCLGWDIHWRGSGADEVGYDLKTGRELVRIDPKFYRAAEVDGLLGDASKARKILGWKQTVGFEEMVEMMVKADIERVAGGVIAF